MNLGMPSASSRATRTVENAFEMLGLKPPVQRGQLPDQGERFIQAITGEKKSIPGWSGQPGTMRSWLKLLAYWETETTVSKDRWGLRLYQSFPEGSQPRKIADQVPMSDLLSDRGYGLILSALLTKYKPYLEIAGPTSIDKFFYTGERGKSESFATYIAAKEVARQDMEMHLQESVCDRVAGRVLLRHANLTEFQREMIALKDQGTLLNFDQVSAMLRPLDRPELLAQAAGAELGSSAGKLYPVMQGMEISKENPEDLDEDEEQFEDSQGSEDEDSELQEGEYMFEDREYDESEAIYIQAYHSAYADVRRDLRDRRKERGFVKRRQSGRFGKGRGRQGNSASSKGWKPPRPNSTRGANAKIEAKYLKGGAEDLQARTRCFNCQELGHFARDCPLKGSGKGAPSTKSKPTFVICRGNGKPAEHFVSFASSWVSASKGRGRTLSVFAGVRVSGAEALVDTAAEDAVIGLHALQRLEGELHRLGLTTVLVSEETPVPCAGIGGEAHICKLVDAPVGVAGVHGILRFSVLKDTEQFQTPPLLPISFLEAVGANIDLHSDTLSTADGHRTSMTRLPSDTAL